MQIRTRLHIFFHCDIRQNRKPKPNRFNTPQLHFLKAASVMLHKIAGHEFEPKAKHHLSGSVDLCLITNEPINKVLEHLKKTNVNIEEGLIKRTDVLGPILSVYIRDPDQNLIEISEYPLNVSLNISILLGMFFLTSFSPYTLTHSFYTILRYTEFLRHVKSR